MKHKVAGLEGALLDAAVAMAEGWARSSDGSTWAAPTVLQTGERGVAPVLVLPAFSTSWSAGGPIIECNRISIHQRPADNPHHPSQWAATIWRLTVPESARLGPVTEQIAPTPLSAAMRAYVASKLGNEVEL